MWLSRNTALSYQIPAQTRSMSRPWYLSLFVDQRDPNWRRLITFPDQSYISLLGHQAIQYTSAKGRTYRKTFPAGSFHTGRKWNHLSWVVNATGTKVQFQLNGLRLWSLSVPSSAPLFDLRPGTLTLGDFAGSGRGFRGVDRRLQGHRSGPGAGDVV